MSRLWGLASFLLINKLGVLSAHGGGGRWRVRIVVLLLGVVGGLVDAAGLHAQEAGLEEGLGAPELLIADGDEDIISGFLMCVH